MISFIFARIDISVPEFVNVIRSSKWEQSAGHAMISDLVRLTLRFVVRNFLSVGIEKILVHLFSWAQADEFDLYFAWRFSALANQRMGQIKYADRIAHVQDQNVAMVTDRECL